MVDGNKSSDLSNLCNFLLFSSQLFMIVVMISREKSFFGNRNQRRYPFWPVNFWIFLRNTVGQILKSGIIFSGSGIIFQKDNERYYLD